MPQFTDINGRDWQLRITVADVRRVRDATGIDIGKILDKDCQPLDDLASDVCKMVDVLYVLCKPQADKLGMTDEQFGESLAGDCIEHACYALLEAIAYFFPSRQRDLVLTMLAMTKQSQETAEKALTDMLSRSDLQELLA